MALQNMQQDQDMNLVLSSDAKPRLKWNPELHQKFVHAVALLGGADKATPKSLMRVMGIHGLTLYHLKSHLQKYRLGKSQQSQLCVDNDQAEYDERQINHASREYHDGTSNQINESLQIAQALQMQIEVQSKLHEQIEVQRHLQLRIEAQGKYLHSVLKKAQDTLSACTSSSAEVKLAKTELSQLVSMVDNGCRSSTLSLSTEFQTSILKESTENKPLRETRSSLESSLTSSESSGRKEDHYQKRDFADNRNANSVVVLSLMEMRSHENSGSVEQACARKRSKCEGDTAEQRFWKRSKATTSTDQLREFDFLEALDLNSHYSNNLDSGPKEIDLNSNQVERFSEN